MIRKKEFQQQNIGRGVSILQLNATQIRRVTVGLKHLFEDELNPMLEQIVPDND
jgi:hypothetical protein